MKKPHLRKSLAIFGAILTGGIGITILGLLPFTEDSNAMNSAMCKTVSPRKEVRIEK